METQPIAESLLSVCLGLGLSAACGFRIFVPFLVMNVAHQAGYLSLGESFEWIGSTPALIAFAVATGLEIAAYYVPWVDNLLDMIASPTAVVAGVIATASVVTGMDPFLRWTLAVIAGGGVAGAVQAVTSTTRHASAITTAGFGNPVVSTVEAGGSFFLSFLSVIWPLIAVILVFSLLFLGAKKIFRRGRTAEQALSQ